MEMLLVNPRRRRKGRAKSRRRSHKRRRKMSAKQAMFFGGGRRRKNPSRRRRGRAHRRRKGYRRNPSFRLPGRGMLGGVGSQVMGALPGAFGALGLDVLLGVLPIPATWKSGMFGYATKIAGAIGLGMLAKMVVSQHTAAQMTNGALTVMFHGILRDFVATNVPSVPLGMYMHAPAVNLGYYGSGWNPTGDTQLGAYLPDMEVSPYSGSMNMESMGMADFA